MTKQAKMVLMGCGYFGSRAAKIAIETRRWRCLCAIGMPRAQLIRTEATLRSEAHEPHPRQRVRRSTAGAYGV